MKGHCPTRQTNSQSTMYFPVGWTKRPSQTPHRLYPHMTEESPQQQELAAVDNMGGESLPTTMAPQQQQHGVNSLVNTATKKHAMTQQTELALQ
eukprot:7381890-Prorocentrum_lima.AAC.1